MKRPLFAAGTTMLLTLFLLCQIDNMYLTIGCCGLFSVLLTAYICLKNKIRTALLPTVLLSVLAACFILAAYEFFVYLPYTNLAYTTVEGNFTLTEYPSYESGRYYCLSKYTDEDGKTYKIRLSLPAVSQYDFDFDKTVSSLEPGDKLSFTAYIYTLGGDSKEIRNSYKSKGVFAGAYPKSEVVVTKTDTVNPLYYLKREKKRTVNLLLSCFDSETASLGISLLMGDKNLLDNGTYETIRNSGVSHLLAVSGLHLSLWIMFVLKIIQNLGLNRRRWAVFLLVFDFLVMSFASFSGSVVRAGIMMAVNLLGFIINESADSLNSLGLSAIIILVANPFGAVNISYLLSFVACLSIIVTAQPLINKAQKYIRRKSSSAFIIKIFDLIITTSIISVVVSVYTLPLISYYFGTVSIVSVITNILIIPVSTALILSFGLYVMFWFIPVLSQFLYAAAFLSTKYFLAVTKFTGAWELSTVSVHTDNFYLTSFSVVMLFLLPAVYGMYKRRKRIKELFKGHKS